MARKKAKARRSPASGRGKPDEGEGKRHVIATNRKARHDYELLAKVEAGLVLRGSEVKSLRLTGADIRDGFGRIDHGELWLHNVHIPSLPQASYLNHEPMRKRKCLVHRRELHKLEEALGAQGLTVVPLELYFKGVRVKVELAVARGRRKGDRRQVEREKSDRKEMRRFTA